MKGYEEYKITVKYKKHTDPSTTHGNLTTIKIQMPIGDHEKIHIQRAVQCAIHELYGDDAMIHPTSIYIVERIGVFSFSPSDIIFT